MTALEQIGVFGFGKRETSDSTADAVRSSGLGSPPQNVNKANT
jgi:protein subunit release factor B